MCSSPLGVSTLTLLSSVRPNPSLKLPRYGIRRLADPGARGILPSAARRRLPSRAA
jgi:hypothetical protein